MSSVVDDDCGFFDIFFVFFEANCTFFITWNNDKRKLVRLESFFFVINLGNVISKNSEKLLCFHHAVVWCLLSVFQRGKKNKRKKLIFFHFFADAFFLKQFLLLKFFSRRRATNIKGSLNKWSSKKGTQENFQRIKNCRMKCTQLRKQPMLRVGGEVNTFFIYSFFLFNIGTFTFIFDRAFSWFWTRGSKKGWLVYVLSK